MGHQHPLFQHLFIYNVLSATKLVNGLIKREGYNYKLFAGFSTNKEILDAYEREKRGKLGDISMSSRVQVPPRSLHLNQLLLLF